MTKILWVAIGFALAGCASQVPIASNHAISFQAKAKSVHHWDVLAKDIASQVQQTVKRDPSLQGKYFYIVPPDQDTAFNKAFQSLLITRLVDTHIPITRKKDGAVLLDFNTQIVRHDSSRYSHIPGTFTSLAAGIWVVRDLLTAGSAALPGTIGALGLVDYGMGQYAGSPTASELIVTTSIAVDSNYLFRKADLYYLEDLDLKLYEESPQAVVKQWEVLGK